MYIRTALRHIVAKRSTFSHLAPILVRFQSTKTSKPLRVLFCGSDEFSCASLKALHVEQQRDPGGIASIDVLCRPGKPSGRHLKFIREVPIKAVADELKLPVHQRDTFTGWELPRPYDEPINLIIAVSFGLFVPPRILRSAEYGGLNVHPSLLPDFRGPAPLQHIIMSGHPYTGVSLQTLDEKDFDHGVILAQTPQEDTHGVNHERSTYQELLERVTPMAANMLVQGIRDKVYVPPYTDRGWYHPQKVKRAPKVTVADREINWKQWSSILIDRRARALGRLWNRIVMNAHTTKRFIFEDIEPVATPEVIKRWLADMKGEHSDAQVEEARLAHNIRFMNFKTAQDDDGAVLFVEDGNAVILAPNGGGGVRVKEITVEGLGKRPAGQVMQSIREGEVWNLKRGQ